MEGSFGWRPTLFDIEPEFTKFVPTFRNGQIVRDLMPDQPAMALNADFYFPNDRVVVELKCMERDSRDTYPERVVRAFTHFGYTGCELMGFLYAEGKESLADFVNPLGTAWINYAERFGEPYLERWKGDDYDAGFLTGKPIERFRRSRK